MDDEVPGVLPPEVPHLVSCQGNDPVGQGRQPVEGVHDRPQPDGGQGEEEQFEESRLGRLDSEKRNWNHRCTVIFKFF